MKSRYTRPVLVVTAAAVVLLLALVGGAIVWANAHSRGAASTTAPTPGPVGWVVGSCLYVSQEFPHPTPTPLTPDMKQIIESAKRYAPISCGDPRALAKITTVGAEVQAAKRNGDNGCPDDTDLAVKQTDDLLGQSHVYCARNLKAPHPGDPGGGGGAVMAGDCVYAHASDAAATRTDVIEMPCGEPGWFAKVLAKTADASTCPVGETLSRQPAGPTQTPVLCLGQGGSGAIAKPGECVQVGPNKGFPTVRAECRATAVGSSSRVYRLVAMADDKSQCPAGSGASREAGYDRLLCLSTIQ